MPRVILFVALLLGVCSSPSGGVRAQGSALAESFREAPAFTAIVTDSVAAFVLPVPERSEWVWGAIETPNNAAEYRWEVAVANGGEEYAFGFYKYRHPSLAPTYGSLDELIEAGQEDLWRTDPDGLQSLVPSAGVRVLPLAPGRVLVGVEGAENVARLFSSRPLSVDVLSATLGESVVERTVEIEYGAGGGGE